MLFFNKKNTQESKTDTDCAKKEFDTCGLDELIVDIKILCGVDLSPKKDVLRQRFIMFCQSKDISSFNELKNKIRINKEIKQEVINLITVNETYFYREQVQLESVVSYILSLPKSVRVLCAPCASGEEVYSIAMMSLESGINISRLSILGIDINSEAIRKSHNGVYSERSLHRLSDLAKDRYFIKTENGYSIKKERLPKLDFSVMNIFGNELLNLPPFDIILSRNMMIYFDNEYKLKTIERFHKILAPEGRLYTGHADLVPTTPLFTKEVESGVGFYRKN